MRILYGVCGEGMGHATRSKVAIGHLRSRGHDVLCAASDQALRVLSSNGAAGEWAGSPPPVRPGGSLSNASLSAAPQPRPVHGSLLVLPIVGLGMRCADGALDLRGSIEENARRLPEMLRVNAGAWSEVEAFTPQAVITDFDSFACLYAASRGLPLVSIDNAQVLPRCLHRPEVLGSHADGLKALEAFTTMKAPDAQHYIVTSFFFPRVKPGLEQTTTLVPPILRREVLDVARARAPGSDVDEGHVLVYKTGSLDDASFLQPLALVPEQRFVVYGLKDPNVALPPNVTARTFDTAAFLRDVATSRAVVGNGGMSLIGEALALGKPIYAVPVRGQYEQVMNAQYLTQLGYGVTSDVLDPNLLRGFLRNLRLHQAIIRTQPQHDENRLLYSTLDLLFGSASACAPATPRHGI